MVVKGTLKAFDSATYKATVQVDGSIATFLTGVPVSRAIPSAEMIADRTVAVLFAMVNGVFQAPLAAETPVTRRSGSCAPRRTGRPADL